MQIQQRTNRPISDTKLAPPVETADDEVEETSDEAETTEETESTETTTDGADKEVSEYLSVDQLPPELKPIGQKMLNAHTKRMAELSEKIKSADTELGTKYAKYVQKASILENLMKTPLWAPFFADLESGKPYGFSSAYKGKETVPDDDDDDSTDGAMPAKKVESLVAAAVNRAMAPLMRERGEKEVASIKEKYPSFEKHRAAVYDHINKNPNTTLEGALWAVAGSELVEEAVAKSIAEFQKDSKELTGKKLRTEKPSTSTGAPGTLGKKKLYKTAAEAVVAAMADLNE